MRTLATQLRLRRLMSVQDEYMTRVRGETLDRSVLAQAAATRLLALLKGVRRSWQQESALAIDNGSSQAPFAVRHVRRTLAALEASVGALATTTADLEALDREFCDLAVGLQVFVQGLEERAAAMEPRRLSA